MIELSGIQKDLRDGLRRLAKVVVVIACRWDGRRYAMTATAVSELSMDPPSLLICVNHTASIHEPLMAGVDFSVNILHSSHEAISVLCSGPNKGEARFAQGLWSATESAIPVIDDAQAIFLCKNETNLSYGTHQIFIGQVVETRISGEVDPLVYVDGRYVIVSDRVTL
jgi:flavin reductase (DIM6/NTAB) family NADH-FMN oxidoreductase RutF